MGAGAGAGAAGATETTAGEEGVGSEEGWAGALAEDGELAEGGVEGGCDEETTEAVGSVAEAPEECVAVCGEVWTGEFVEDEENVGGLSTGVTGETTSLVVEPPLVGDAGALELLLSVELEADIFWEDGAGLEIAGVVKIDGGDATCALPQTPGTFIIWLLTTLIQKGEPVDSS